MEKSVGRTFAGRSVNVLLIHTGHVKPEDVLEATRELDVNLSVADSREEALGSIAARPIDAVIFTLRTFDDLELLKYLNTEYPQLHVVLSAGDSTSEIISILKNGRYRMLPAAFRLQELKRFLENIRSECDKTQAIAASNTSDENCVY